MRHDYTDNRGRHLEIIVYNAFKYRLWDSMGLLNLMFVVRMVLAAGDAQPSENTP